MGSPGKNYLLFVTKAYSFDILVPLQDYLGTTAGGSVRWFTASSAGSHKPPGEQLLTTAEVEEYNPAAVLVPGNVVPPFWPGLKVQIFHGLGEEKRGHYRISGFFDLYCTPGPLMTERFQRLAEKHGHFLVRETGWPKLDPLAQPADPGDLRKSLGLVEEQPTILYAPTFSPRYSSARDLLAEIVALQDAPYQWVVKFHELMDQGLVAAYQQAAGKRLKVITTGSILPLLRLADTLVTDTSSVAYEFMLLDRPIITYRTATWRDKGIDISQSAELHGALERSLIDPREFAPNRAACREQIHPYNDGRSSQRVLDAIAEVLESGAHRNLEPKPRNWLKKRRLRRRRLVP